MWLSAVTILILQGIALYTWQFRREPGARWQCYVQICKGILLFSVLMIPQASSGGMSALWREAYAVLGLLTCYFWFRCIGEISTWESRFPAWLIPALRAGSAFFCLIALTDFWHHWFFGVVSAGDSGGPLGYASLLFAYGQMGAALWINVLWARNCTGLRRRQAYCFVLPTLCGWTGQFLSNFPQVAEFDPHTLGFLAAGVLMAYAFLRWRAYSILPLAQQALVEAMVDGLMIVDESGYIVEMNQRARGLFADPGVRVGGSIQTALRLWPALEDLQQRGTLHDARLEQEGEARYFMVVRTPLATPGSDCLGQILVFKETTVEKHQQEWILEQGKALSMLEERERLGRELHDGPGQIWSFLAAQTQAARLHLAHGRLPQADRMLAELQQVVKESYTGLRESILGLHADLSGGLLKALEEQLQWYRMHCAFEAQLHIECDWRNDLLTPQAELQVLRILQEALANSRKSAQTRRAHVTIDRKEDDLIFLVEDDGVGFVVDEQQMPGKHGLRIMQERAHSIGGALQIVSSPGQGCQVRLTVMARKVQCATERDQKVEMER